MIVGPEGAVFDEAHDKPATPHTMTATLKATMDYPSLQIGIMT
jgi:hypothetical protein